MAAAAQEDDRGADGGRGSKRGGLRTTAMTASEFFDHLRAFEQRLPGMVAASEFSLKHGTHIRKLGKDPTGPQIMRRTSPLRHDVFGLMAEKIAKDGITGQYLDTRFRKAVAAARKAKARVLEERDETSTATQRRHAAGRDDAILSLDDSIVLVYAEAFGITTPGDEDGELAARVAATRRPEVQPVAAKRARRERHAKRSRRSSKSSDDSEEGLSSSSDSDSDGQEQPSAAGAGRASLSQGRPSRYSTDSGTPGGQHGAGAGAGSEPSSDSDPAESVGRRSSGGSAQASARPRRTLVSPDSFSTELEDPEAARLSRQRAHKRSRKERRRRQLEGNVSQTALLRDLDAVFQPPAQARRPPGPHAALVVKAVEGDPLACVSVMSEFEAIHPNMCLVFGQPISALVKLLSIGLPETDLAKLGRAMIPPFRVAKALSQDVVHPLRIPDAQAAFRSYDMSLRLLLRAVPEANRILQQFIDELGAGTASSSGPAAATPSETAPAVAASSSSSSSSAAPVSSSSPSSTSLDPDSAARGLA